MKGRAGQGELDLGRKTQIFPAGLDLEKTLLSLGPTPMK